jgi:hypothetical protein
VGEFIFLGMLFLISGDRSPVDLLSLIDAEVYFRSHNIEIRAANLLRIAEVEAQDAPGEVARLLAIRWLGNQAGNMKKPDVEAVLRRVSRGKAYRDAHTFPEQYALRALAQVERQPAPPMAVPDDSLRDTFGWCPAGVDLCFALDLRWPSALKPLNEKERRDLIGVLSSDTATQQQAIQLANVVGNFRLDRAAFSWAPVTGRKDQTSLWLRLSGQMNGKRLAEFVRRKVPGVTLEQKVEEPGIAVVRHENNQEAEALIGDTDLIVVNTEGKDPGAIQMLRTALEVRAGRMAGATAGDLGARLKKVSARAFGLVMGPVPKEPNLDGPFDVAFANPQSVELVLAPEGKGISVRLSAAMADADEAEQLAEAIDLQRKGYIIDLKELPPSVRPLIHVLEGIKIDVRGNTVRMEVRISPEGFQVIQDLLLKMRRSERQIRLPGAGGPASSQLAAGPRASGH